MNNCTLLVFGATGDLAKRKLIPAIYKLIEDKKLINFALVGAAFSPVTAHEMLEQAKEFIENFNQDIWQQLMDRSYYQHLDFNDAHGYANLKVLVERTERLHELSGSRLVYLATAADYFCPITHHLSVSGIIQRDQEESSAVWHRVVYEKPFGINKQSALQINDCIARNLNEFQAFRIDHYLTKELVSNIALVRFTNIIFEPLWNAHHVECVQIRINEAIGLEGRGQYYDKYGVIKDVVQNHALQLLALIAMERPTELSGEYIRDQKEAVLERVQCDEGVLGQYEGYRLEKNVSDDSQTPTYALLRMFVNTKRWKGVPFYIETGKRLEKKETVITIKFKDIVCPLVKGSECPSNSLVIHVEPEASFALNLNVKPRDFANGVTPVKMKFSHSEEFGSKTPLAYEILLESILAGDQAISVRFDEIEQSWRIIESIETLHLPVHEYAQGSTGPKQAIEFLKQHHVRWQS